MEFLREIAKILGADSAGVFRIQYAVVDGRGGYFQNVKRLVRIADEEVVVRGKVGAIRIAGRGLAIGKYYAGDLWVTGEIVCVERLEGDGVQG